MTIGKVSKKCKDLSVIPLAELVFRMLVCLDSYITTQTCPSAVFIIYIRKASLYNLPSYVLIILQQQ